MPDEKKPEGNYTSMITRDKVAPLTREQVNNSMRGGKR